ncbi:MAG: hypothetical protein IKB45_00535 [Clostridia bacterium]|nr:hypothetical protein [Clostridia bacterium]
MPEETNIKPKSQFANIIIVQAVFIAIILITVIITKYFFDDIYSDLKAFYTEQICSETDINEVIGVTDEI